MKRRKILFENPGFLKAPKPPTSARESVHRARRQKKDQPAFIPADAPISKGDAGQREKEPPDVMPPTHKKTRKMRYFFNNLFISVLDNLVTIIVMLILSIAATLIIITLVNGNLDGLIESIGKLFSD